MINDENILLDNKIIWRGTLRNVKNVSEIFYPSFAKRIDKYQTKLQSFFDFQIVKADREILENLFFPSYESYIVSKNNYHLNKTETYQTILKNIQDRNDYYLLSIFDKHDKNKIYGGTIFFVRDGKVGFCYKAYNHQITKDFKINCSLDYWAEKLVFDFGIKNNCQFISHGKDAHPYIDNPGLCLFKLRAGCKPFSGLISKEIKNKSKLAFQEVNLKKLMQENNLFIYFTEPDSLGFFQKINIYYRDNFGNNALINEFKKIIEWAKIIYNINLYS
ncbi:hypothetical protein GYA19_01065 [Candidatus Beckwithbacteria bacterium]|nr:hypothetical protein [Candidatus Beckwithbacteria bacterium]